MDTMDCIVLMYDSKRHVGGATDILDRGSTPLTSISQGVQWFRQGTRSMTENLLGEQTTDAKSSDTAANNIVAFSRILTREFARTDELVTA